MPTRRAAVCISSSEPNGRHLPEQEWAFRMKPIRYFNYASYLVAASREVAIQLINFLCFPPTKILLGGSMYLYLHFNCN